MFWLILSGPDVRKRCPVLSGAIRLSYVRSAQVTLPSVVGESTEQGRWGEGGARCYDPLLHGARSYLANCLEQQPHQKTPLVVARTDCDVAGRPFFFSL